jgi:hypothetical protein
MRARDRLGTAAMIDDMLRDRAKLLAELELQSARLLELERHVPVRELALRQRTSDRGMELPDLATLRQENSMLRQAQLVRRKLVRLHTRA